MLSFLKNRTYPIGADISDEIIKVVQLADNGQGVSLLAGGNQTRPIDVRPRSSNWQRWAIEAISGLTANSKFHGREVVAVMPANGVFIDHMRMPRVKSAPRDTKQGAAEYDQKLRDAIFSRIKQKLPFDPNDAMMKYMPAEENNVVVIASERKEIDRHLAIYEKANLTIKSINVWPVALINIYTAFFGRRKTDLEAIVMLLEIDTNCTNVVICRFKNLLFARSIPIGTAQLEGEDAINRLVLELTTCKRQFSSMQQNPKIERIIFLTTQAAITNTCAAIAKQMEMPAQMGNCLAAIQTGNSNLPEIDRRDCKVNWATAFGLSLSQ